MTAEYNKDIGVLHIEVEAHVPWARGVVRRYAEKLGFEKKTLSEIELCISELATNLVVHRAKNGRVCFNEIKQNGRHGIQIVVQDEGPGIKDIKEALHGGTSSAGSLGQGLASVQRLADEFDIHSNSKGTKIRICKFLPPEQPESETDYTDLVVSVSVRTHPEAPVCGDGHVIRHDGHRTLLAVIDGLGHGERARKAASVVEAYLHANYRKPLEQQPAELHKSLRATRGAVVGIARLDEDEGKIDFVGLGNISARLWLPDERSWVRPVSMSGTLGVSYRPPRIFSYPWKKGSMLIMHSDGITERWDLSTEERSQHPTDIARTLMKEYWRRNDDATVMVAK